MNRVVIIGRLGQDPESKVVGDGLELTKFSVGSSRFVKKGEDKATDWFNCSAFGSKGAFIAKYLKKGDQVTVVGQMQSNKKDDKTYWSVFVEDVEIGAHKSDTKTETEAKPDVVQDDELPF